MKTTIEIPDPLFRRAKALAASRGIPLRQLVSDAIADQLDGPRRTAGSRSRGAAQQPAWRGLSGALRGLREETARVSARIEEDAERVDAERVDAAAVAPARRTRAARR